MGKETPLQTKQTERFVEFTDRLIALTSLVSLLAPDLGLKPYTTRSDLVQDAIYMLIKHIIQTIRTSPAYQPVLDEILEHYKEEVLEVLGDSVEEPRRNSNNNP